MELATAKDPRLQRRGALHDKATSSGTVDLRCSDGIVLSLPFTALSAGSAHAQVATAGGIAGLTLGAGPLMQRVPT